MDVQTIVRTQGSGNQGVKMGIAFITINPSDSLATFFFFTSMPAVGLSWFRSFSFKKNYWWKMLPPRDVTMIPPN